MKNDPNEKENVINIPRFASTRKELRSKLDLFFTKYADPKYDRWKGGATKGNEILKEN